MANAHLFPSSLALAATLRIYLEDHGLTVGELVEVCQRLLAPERRATHKFASDLMADLSALVAETLRVRRSREQQDARRRADSKDRAASARGDGLGDLLRGIVEG